MLVKDRGRSRRGVLPRSLEKLSLWRAYSSPTESIGKSTSRELVLYFSKSPNSACANTVLHVYHLFNPIFGCFHFYTLITSQFIEDLITIKHWRCNLSALSHVYNLYFLACNDEIYVYAPLFPDQHLDQPSLILAVPRTGLETMPGIDLSEPHSVTRLHVDYLGNTEVLLVTCDDGDVVGWRVTEIVSPVRGCHGERILVFFLPTSTKISIFMNILTSPAPRNIGSRRVFARRRCSRRYKMLRAP